MARFSHPEVGQLGRELLLSPARLRPRQLEGIAHLIDLIDPDTDYPYALVCFHITGYRPRRGPDSVLGGRDLVSDLIELMDLLTESNPLPSEAAVGPLYDSDALAQRLRVSTKTISRWRKRGLCGFWYQMGERARLAFDGRAVQRFVARHGDLVRRGATFQLMRADERDHIVARARELVATQKCSLHIVTQMLAEETGRAIETIRYTLRRWDKQNPDESLFDGREQAQTISEAAVVLEALEAGEDVRSLAVRFDRSEAEIRRLIAQARVDALRESPIDYVYNESFDAPAAEREILAEAIEPDTSDEAELRIPAELPAYLKELYRTPLLGRDEERLLFRRMNYHQHRAERARQAATAMGTVTAANFRRVTTLLAALDAESHAASELKNRIIRANLRLVVSIAKKHLYSHPGATLFELVSDGNLALMRAVEKFDYARGFRFSTYGSWAIMRGYARSIPDELSHSGRFQTGHEEMLSATRDDRAVEASEFEPADVDVRSAVSRCLRSLDDREREIVVNHFGLGGAAGGRTLEEIGREMGLSKERVRQIELKAFAKLRGVLGERGAELLAG
ncbi:RNA polymerase principal sigma factor HrdA [Phycisphaerae bacterium RAS2]|nr:RNA polymerase principal sigma factor HrdA [Phycisphaerae bacterium RAS2]